METVGYILSQIKTLAVMDLDDISPEPSVLDSKLIGFLNLSLKKRAKQAYNVQFSDPLEVTEDGFKAFQKGNQPITDMYEPLALYDENDQEVRKRTSFGGTGWFRESPNLNIHTRGITGEFRLKYIQYPRKIESADEPLDQFPAAGYWDLIMDVVALIKFPKNFYDEYDAVKKEATGTSTVKATIDSRGTNVPPNLRDREG